MMISPNASPSENRLSMQQALDVSRYVELAQPGIYFIDDILFLPSGSRFYIAPCATLKLADGARTYLMTNATPSSGNEGIWIYGGGVIDGNATNNPPRAGVLSNIPASWDDAAAFRTNWINNGLEFVNLRHSRIKDIRFRDCHKYCVHSYHTRDSVFENLNFESRSDGLHFDGEISRCVVRNISGNTNDDLVAWIGSTWAQQRIPAGLGLPIEGDAYDCIFSGLRGYAGAFNAIGAKQIMRLVPGWDGVSVYRKARRILIEEASGQVEFQGIWLKPDTGSPYTSATNYGDIRIRNVAIENNYPTRYPLQIDNTQGEGTISIENVSSLRSDGTAIYIAGGNWAQVSISRMQTPRDVREAGGCAGHGIYQNAGSITDFRILDSDWRVAASATADLVQSRTTVGRLQVAGCVVRGNSATQGNGINLGAGSVGRLEISDTHFENIGVPVLAAVACDHVYKGVTFASTNSRFLYATAGAHNVSGDMVGSESVANWLTRSGAATIKPRGRFRMSGDFLPTSGFDIGDNFYNTNAAWGLGVGMYQWDGLTWEKV